MLQQHLDAGRIHPSSSQYTSPTFIIPKSDPAVSPQLVNDYRKLDSNTVPDNRPFQRIDDILVDCARGKFWAKIDIANSFFQTRIHPDDVRFAAITAPFGLYERLVMQMGCRNAPATHQRRMCAALRPFRPFNGKICHVYLDEVIIWWNSFAEHLRNIEKILARTQDVLISKKD